ncbi:MAG TPA: hypothetical protein V6D14_34190 [Coleofasciculaceae cyanobacterium]|jgi:hypothetical protein
MFTQFRVRYPKGSLLTELSAIDHGKYIVRCLVQDEGTTLVTSLAAAETVELAEDKARSRALAILGISSTIATEEKEMPVVTREISLPMTPTPNASPVFSDTPSVASATLSENFEQSQPQPIPEVVKASDPSSVSFGEPRYEEVADPVATTPLVSKSRYEEVADPVATTPLVAEEIPFTDDFSPTEVETSQEMEVPLWATETIPSDQLNNLPAPDSPPKKPKKDTPKTASTDKPIDFSDVIARTNVELKRLGWTNQQGRDYLVQTYGKRSRQLLTDSELLDFLHHLESEPTPE